MGRVRTIQSSEINERQSSDECFSCSFSFLFRLSFGRRIWGDNFHPSSPWRTPTLIEKERSEKRDGLGRGSWGFASSGELGIKIPEGQGSELERVQTEVVVRLQWCTRYFFIPGTVGIYFIGILDVLNSKSFQPEEECFGIPVPKSLYSIWLGV